MSKQDAREVFIKKMENYISKLKFQVSSLPLRHPIFHNHMYLPKVMHLFSLLYVAQAIVSLLFTCQGLGVSEHVL